MIKKIFILFFFMFLMSCGGIELVLKNDKPNNIKNKVSIVLDGNIEQRFAAELYSFFGNNTETYEYILTSSFLEKKENKIIKKNQVAQKTDYTIEADYNLFFQNKSCNIVNKKIITKFSFLSKSSGYNFGADRSYEELYKSSIKQNIQNFIDVIPTKTDCL